MGMKRGFEMVRKIFGPTRTKLLKNLGYYKKMNFDVYFGSEI